MKRSEADVDFEPTRGSLGSVDGQLELELALEHLKLRPKVVDTEFEFK